MLETPIKDTTLKIELIDNSTSNRDVLSTSYVYFPKKKSTARVLVTKSDDLNLSRATRDARYKISYLVDKKGSIVTGQYNNAKEYEALKSKNSEISNDSRDNFAIRPDSFFVTITDGNMTRKTNIQNDDIVPFRVASGYNYNLNVVAQKYSDDIMIAPSIDYNTSITRLLEFEDSPTCNDNRDITTTEMFSNGINTTKLFSNSNVGRYKLKIIDRDWTRVDSEKNTSDCILNNTSISLDDNNLSGCNIGAISDIGLFFYPYQFDINFTQMNLPSSGHDDFLYMSPITKDYHKVAVQFEGDITAQNANGDRTSNFTAGCAGENVSLLLDASTISEDGINKSLHTTKGTSVYITRMIRFNNEPFISAKYDDKLSSISNSIHITADKFLDENNGSTTLDIRYNINKNLSETINPIEIDFHKFIAESSYSYSIANDKVNSVSNQHIPKGLYTINNSTKNFYFTKVVSDLDSYPRVQFPKEKSIRTPLNVDIFCDKSNSYCQDRKVFDNSNNTPRSQLGWYLSINHNKNRDGNITQLTPNPNIVSISPNLPIGLENGRNGLVFINFNSCSGTNQKSTITITPELALRYDSNIANSGLPHYTVSCTTVTPGTWTGVGQTGNIVEVIPNSKKSGKMDW